MSRFSLRKLIALLLLGGLALWTWFSTESDKVAPVSKDAFVESLMSSHGQVEARAWVEQGKQDGIQRTLFEFGQAETARTIEEIYQLGANVVYAVGVQKDTELGETVNILVVELPSTPDKRRALFQYEGVHARKHGFDPEPDRGQKFLFLRWT